MNLRQKILRASDRVICALIVVLVLGSTVGFGGAVWWFRPVMAVAAFLLVARQADAAPAGRRNANPEEPAHPAGTARPGPGRSPACPLAREAWQAASHQQPTRPIHGGFFADLVHADDPEASLPEAPQVRSPASLDRSATLRWLVGASACLGIFWAVSHFTDRLGRLYLVWGLVVAGFLLNAALAIVQITNRSDGLYGLYLPGQGPMWAPTLDDLLETPTTTTLRTLSRIPLSSAASRSVQASAVLNPTRPFLFGTMMGGCGSLAGTRCAGHAACSGDRLAHALTARQPGESGKPAGPLESRKPRDLAGDPDAPGCVPDWSGCRAVVLLAGGSGVGHGRLPGTCCNLARAGLLLASLWVS